MTVERMDSLLGVLMLLLIIPCAFGLVIGAAHAGDTPAAFLGFAPLAVYAISLFTVFFPYSRAVQQREVEHDWERATELVRSCLNASRSPDGRS
jgi:hypothetical protein